MKESPVSSHDVEPIAAAIFRRVQVDSGVDLGRWSGPEVVRADSGDYRLAWYPPGRDEAGLVVYRGGDWELSDLAGGVHVGRVIRPHDRRWVAILVRAGCTPDRAGGSSAYFRGLATPSGRVAP
jgi:hypothetical protein